MVPSSERNWIAVDAVQQSNLNKKMKTKNMTTLHLRKSINRPPQRRGFLVIPLAVALAWFAFSPQARGLCQEFCNDNLANTFLGTSAGANNTTGNNNTAVGFFALNSNTTGYNNTANGFY